MKKEYKFLPPREEILIYVVLFLAVLGLIYFLESAAEFGYGFSHSGDSDRESERTSVLLGQRFGRWVKANGKDNDEREYGDSPSGENNP